MRLIQPHIPPHGFIWVYLIMSMIGNRFSALKVNVQDPFSKSKTRIKRIKTLPEKEKKVETSVKPICAVAEETQVKNVKSESKMAKTAVIVVVDLKAAAIKKESARSVVTAVESAEGGGSDVKESLVVDDDRGTQNRSHYKKMIDSGKGRMMDRQGGAKTKGKPTEKRHGHGVYNWGDQIEDEDGKLDVESANAPKEEHVAEVNVPQYTLEEFREFQKDNKVSPLLWGETGPLLADAAVVTSQKDEFDFREYQYRRNSDNRTQNRGHGRSRRGDLSRPPMSGENRDTEKSFVARGNRGPRGSRVGYRGQSTRGTPRGTISKEVRIDDQSDFPDINQFN